MNPILENLASKKFGTTLFVIYVLWDTAAKQPEHSLVYISLMCGMAVFYTLCTIVQDYVLAEKPKDGLPDQTKP